MKSKQELCDLWRLKLNHDGPNNTFLLEYEGKATISIENIVSIIWKY